MRNFYRYSPRDAVKNYFPLPNEIFTLGLSAGEIAVYAYLLYREDRKTFRCYPSYNTIGDAVDAETYQRMMEMDELIKKRLIEAEPTQVTTKRGRRNGNLCYTVRPIEEAVKANYDRQMAQLEEENRRQAAIRKLAEYDRKHPKKAI